MPGTVIVYYLFVHLNIINSFCAFQHVIIFTTEICINRDPINISEQKIMKHTCILYNKVMWKHQEPNPTAKILKECYYCFICEL